MRNISSRSNSSEYCTVVMTERVWGVRRPLIISGVLQLGRKPETKFNAFYERRRSTGKQTIPNRTPPFAPYTTTAAVVTSSGSSSKKQKLGKPRRHRLKLKSSSQVNESTAADIFFNFFFFTNSSANTAF